MRAEASCEHPASRARARVVYIRGDKSPNNNLLDKPRVRAPAREGGCGYAQDGRAKPSPEDGIFRAWRIRKFGGDFNPVKVAVDGAVRDFGSPKDTNLWLWYA